MPLIWSFRCYVKPDGTDVIRRWYEDEAGNQTKARFLSKLKILGHLPWLEWNETYHKELHGDCAGLGELRFKADGVQQRPLGFRSGEREFTILLCAKERSNKFNPRNACAIGLARKAEVIQDRSRTNVLWLALE
jgi:hypothetical protein